jgi:hypothetical protein
VRGLRKIEKAILTRQGESAKTQTTVKDCGTDHRIGFSRTLDDRAPVFRPAQALKHSPITRR